MQQRGCGYARCKMVVHMSFPQQLSGRRIQRIDVGFLIAEISSGGLSDHWRGRHASICLEGPIDTPGTRVQRIKSARFASDENPSAGNARLRACDIRITQSERPLEFELGNIAGRDSRRRGALKARVLEGPHPTAPTEDPSRNPGTRPRPAAQNALAGGGTTFGLG